MKRAKTRHQFKKAGVTYKGDLPAVRHPNWRERCRHDLVAFAKIYCRSRTNIRFLKWSPSPDGERYLRALQDAILGDGRIHVRFPRGIGKTSLGKCAMAWATLFGHRRYVFFGAANITNAKCIVDDLWEFFEGNPRIAADFPLVAVPIQRLERRFARCAFQHIDGKPTNIDHSQEGFTLPTIPTSEASGVMFVARGYQSGVRGLVHGAQRPDFAFIDDPQKQKGANSPIECDKIEAWITGDVLGLGGHDQTMSAVMTTTPICDGDVSERFADRNLHPEWETITVPFVKSWPKRDDLWQQYLDLRARDQYDKTVKNFATATQFYLDHRAEMDEGAECIDARAYNHKLEMSAIQHAYNLKFTTKDSFDAEYQLSPARATTVYDLNPGCIFAHTVKGLAPLKIPQGFKPIYFSAATDINRATAGLTSSIIGFDNQLTAHVFWYGIWKTKITNDIPRDVRDRLVYEALVAHGREIVEAAKIVPVKDWGVDASGEAYATLMRLAGAARSLGLVNVLPMTGQSGQNWKPWRQKGIVGHVKNDTMELVDHDGNHRVAFCADRHRESSQTAWLGEIGSPSRITIFDGGQNHAVFAKQICAERLVAKGVDPKTREPFWQWDSNEHNPHDYGDSVTMNFALAAFRGIMGSTEVTAVSPKSKPTRRWVTTF